LVLGGYDGAVVVVVGQKTVLGVFGDGDNRSGMMLYHAYEERVAANASNVLTQSRKRIEVG
jgi:hypothetical protein